MPSGQPIDLLQCRSITPEDVAFSSNIPTMNQPATRETTAVEPPAPHRKSTPQRSAILSGVGVIVGMALFIASAPFLCFFLLSITSRCGFVAQWNALITTTPLAPIPNQATLLSQRDRNGQPFQGTGGTIRRLYGEVYSTPATPDAVVAFYQQHGATCSRQGAGASSYWHCEVSASGSGWGWIDIFTPDAYLVAPPEMGIDSYNLARPLPHQGTILRTFINWCDDV